MCANLTLRVVKTMGKLMKGGRVSPLHCIHMYPQEDTTGTALIGIDAAELCRHSQLAERR